MQLLRWPCVQDQSWQSSSFEDGLLYLRLDWSAAELAHYDLECWQNPLRHETALDAAMKGMARICMCTSEICN